MSIPFFQGAVRAVLAVFFTCYFSGMASAQSATSVSGSVTYQGAPVPAATVMLLGSNLRLAGATDAAGSFSFPALPAGHYTVRVVKGTLVGSTSVDAGSAGASVAIVLSGLKQIGAASVAANTANRGSGTNVAFSGTQISDSAQADNFPDFLAHLPAAARGSNGQIHVNGDHANINYIIDGVPMPQTLVRVLGNEFDLANVSYAEFIEGAYPAEYGDHFGLVANIGTRSASTRVGASLELGTGNLGKSGAAFTYHTPAGRGGSLLFSARALQSGRGLDPPASAPLVHDRNSAATQFLRVSLPARGDDNLNFDINASYATFQIPPDTANGVPVKTDDTESQKDIFATLQYRHAIGSHGFLSFGPIFRLAVIQDTNDPKNDLAPAAGNDCAAKPGDCVFSAATVRAARSYAWMTEYGLRSNRHDVRAGVSYRTDAVSKHYDIVVQPDNFVQHAPVSLIDDEPNGAHTQALYVQDAWQMGRGWSFEYGVRADAFQLASSTFKAGFAQISPRVKMTRTFSSRGSIYVYYGRLFEPFSFENISGGGAQFLNPLGTAAFDLQPERDSLYETGAHIPIGTWDLGVRVMHKSSAHTIDDGQVGATNIHQDINFFKGATDIQSALLGRALPRGGKIYFSATHSRAVNKGCGSSLLIDCSAFPSDFVQADHDQTWSATAGMVAVFDRDWYSWSGEYGSGLSATECATCKVPPHLTLDATYGRVLAEGVAVEFTVKNLLDDRYAFTLNSSLQGTHYAPGRSAELRLTFDGR